MPGASPSQLKVVILAAGKDAITPDGHPLVLQKLGEQSILQYVVQNAEQLASSEDIHIVVGYRQDEVRAKLDSNYQYIVQENPNGTGAAVREVTNRLQGFHGNLLILYGDTPLFRPGSIRGLLNRHKLRNAHLTLLTAVVDRRLPYGRIIRDAAGQIIDIIEDTEASPEVRAIRELNVGAYVVNADTIATALAKLSPSPIDGDYRLTDCVHELIRSGLRVESYQLFDQDEVQGINSTQDLEHAQFIIEKRLYRPRRQEEQNLIAFGTGGWRALIGEGFTLHNVRRLSQALANEITRQNLEKRGVIIG
jgi:bifunctional N-acetylglucosamine-1-phosphate-uridyltransferase/glucosamine-1-phosphate-acetyltransferase GlmU-like protein